MSGGSYEYASLADSLEEVLRHREQLRRIADRLEAKTNADDAAADLTSLLDYVAVVQRRVAARLTRLDSVLHYVEWTDSGDTGEDSLDLALMRYRGDVVTHAPRALTGWGLSPDAVTACGIGGPRRPFGGDEPIVDTGWTCPPCESSTAVKRARG